MDFSKLENRTRAERGEWLHLVHPDTGQPLYDDEEQTKPCRLLIRGSSSPTIQRVLRERQLAEFERERKLSKDKLEELRRVRVMEDVHRQFVEGAAPFIIAFENVIRDGRPATVPEDVAWFLDLVFPVMHLAGEGSEARFELANKPFGHQVAEFTAAAEVWRGNV